MGNWLRRLRGAIGMGITWGALWAVAGVSLAALWSLGVPLGWFFEIFDAPAPAMMIPGFFAGAFFSIVLGIAGRRRKFSELSLPLFAGLGAIGGLMLSLLPAAMVAVGLASLSDPGDSVWPVTFAFMGPLTALSALSATISLLLARRAESRGSLNAGDGGASAIGEGEARDISDQGARRSRSFTK